MERKTHFHIMLLDHVVRQIYFVFLKESVQTKTKYPKKKQSFRQ